MTPIDGEGIRRTVEDVIAAMLSIPEDETTFPKAWFPGAACEQTSIAIAGVLKDRGFGDWTYVQATQPGELGGHAWLELRDADGAVMFTIDATLAQFSDLADGPYVGEGATPAAARFSNVWHDGPYTEWKFLGTESQPFLKNLEQVRTILAGH